VAESRTINDLPIGAHKGYAQWEKQSQDDLVLKMRFDSDIPGRTRIEVTHPGILQQLDILLGLPGQGISWADFEAPSKIPGSVRGLFEHLVVPSLGSDEHQEQLRRRIKTAIESPPRPAVTEEPLLPWEVEQLKNRTQREGETLASMLDETAKMSRNLELVIAARSRYYRA